MEGLKDRREVTPAVTVIEAEAVAPARRKGRALPWLATGSSS